MPTQKRSVVIAHPEALPAEGLTRVLLGAGYKVAARVSEPGGIQDAVIAANPDIVLIHNSMLDPELSLVGQLADHPGRKIAVLICDSQPEAFALHTVLAGARGCLSCNDTPAQFVSALKFLIEGATVVSPGCNQVLKTTRSIRTPMDEPEDLSVRERQVAILIGRGATNREISQQLDVSEHTVKIHVRSILNKLNLRNRHQVAAYVTHQVSIQNAPPPDHKR